jgi:hypothetical protein
MLAKLVPSALVEGDFVCPRSDCPVAFVIGSSQIINAKEGNLVRDQSWQLQRYLRKHIV